ncbi:hypothetical protein A9R00_03450 [Oleispira antarctica]|uniref:Sulfotransferase family protein n=1 Tax=Oleispira antarctica TaxID=188908 RepID=A0A1Y5HYR9_OLEAN|nr:hypothetical protein A9R00_03450 [Oleispira antarctica]
MNDSKLKNKGFAFLNEGKKTAKKNIIVLGVARGGTSLVAGALDSLGVFMGDQSVAPVYEDVLLSSAFEGSNKNEVKKIIEDYDNRFNVWGWKRPAAVEYLEDVSREITNPHYIVIFKDIFSVANRNNISMKSDVISAMSQAYASFGKLIEFVGDQSAPVMLVSADKVLHDKEDFVSALIDFCQLNVDAAKKAKAIDFITPNPKAYLENTRITKVVGCVDNLSRHRVSGWVYGVHHSNEVEVEVFCDGKFIASSVASNYRKDLKDLSIHTTGMCGFDISLENLVLPTAGAELTVLAKDDVDILRNGRASL